MNLPNYIPMKFNVTKRKSGRNERTQVLSKFNPTPLPLLTLKFYNPNYATKIEYQKLNKLTFDFLVHIFQLSNVGSCGMSQP
jgi:hypothetical protein